MIALHLLSHNRTDSLVHMGKKRKEQIFLKFVDMFDKCCFQVQSVSLGGWPNPVHAACLCYAMGAWGGCDELPTNPTIAYPAAYLGR